ncbi:MAG: helix-turn-helix domain-containing protein [Treponema sp.]|jgi:transcriptional regulator with XRE-family HTH domain|nr:helix-turn-helix domain-containing protein [Treponema sp.]
MADGKAIFNRIIGVLAEKDLKRLNMCKAIGIKSQNITNIKKSIPAADTAIKIADYLRVSVKWLITGEDEISFTQNERILLDGFRQLDSRDQGDVLGIVEMKLENAKRGDILSSSANA